MGMEHRWSERKQVTMDVTLHYDPVGQISGKTRDISLEGMFIETDGVTIPSRAEVKVMFETNTLGAKQSHCVPAYVVHNDENGIGLLLRHSGYEEFYALRHMLRAA